jgi:sugar lactone lactonase YvrE
MKKGDRTIALSSFIAVLAMVLGPWSQISSGEPNVENGPNFITGLENPPEDLLHIPYTSWIIASGMGIPGSLYAIDIETKSSKKLDISYIKDALQAGQTYNNCPAPIKESKFSPHGINAHFDKKGRHTLYVVNHAERESIEIFDMEIGSHGPRITWKGCVVMPNKTNPNSVVPLKNGGLAVTSMFDPTDKNLKEKMLGGEKTGRVLEWNHAEGWSIVPGSELQGNNGLQISSDERWYFVSGWFGRTLTKLSRNQTPVQKKTINLEFLPDNIRWSADGDLIVTGHGSTLANFYECAGAISGCEPDSTIIRVDPKNMQTHNMLKLPGNKDFSTASVAVQTQNEIFVGTFAKNRIVFFPNP